MPVYALYCECLCYISLPLTIIDYNVFRILHYAYCLLYHSASDFFRFVYIKPFDVLIYK